MPEETPRTLNHFALFALKDAYWPLSPAARADLHTTWLRGLREAAPAVELDQAAESGADLIVWSALPLTAAEAPARFF